MDNCQGPSEWLWSRVEFIALGNSLLLLSDDHSKWQLKEVNI